jgi:hypothetical protein
MQPLNSAFRASSCLFFRQPQARGVLQKADLMTTNQRCRGCTTWRSHTQEMPSTEATHSAAFLSHMHTCTPFSNARNQTPTHTSLLLTADPCSSLHRKIVKVWHGDDLPNTPPPKRYCAAVQPIYQSFGSRAGLWPSAFGRRKRQPA